MKGAPPESLRILPTDLLQPLDLNDCFGQARPVEVDLGCGKGRFLLAHAADRPDLHLLGIDRMLRRIRKIDRKAVRAQLQNVRLLRMDAYYAVTYLLPPNSISTYYILFPDPWPKQKHHNHRLFNPPFVQALVRTLIPGGTLHVATDHLPYFEKIQQILQECPDFAPADTWEPNPQERTDFELLFIDSHPIGRASYRRK